MATVTATRGAANFPVAGHGFGGNLKVAYGSYTMPSNLVTGTIIEMCRVPKGAVVLGGRFFGDVVDTGTTPAFDADVGWAANGDEAIDADGFGNFGVLSTAAVTGVKPEATGFNYPLGNTLLVNGPKTFGAETVITATINASAATFATASHLNVEIYFALP